MNMRFKINDTSNRASKEKEIFYKYLHKKGLKRTAQRDTVLDVFLDIDTHQTAEDLWSRLRETHHNVGYSTVYRTLKLLKECELAREVYFADGRTYFEQQFEQPHHDHMVCRKCGLTIEFYNPTIEKLQVKTAAEHDFTPTSHTMVIFGYCKKCEKRRKEHPGDA